MSTKKYLSNDYGAWFRVSWGWSQLVHDIDNLMLKKLSYLERSEVKKALGKRYAELTRPYVPQSDLNVPDEQHLYQSYTVTDDGRIVWSVESPNGYNYAYIQATEEKFEHPTEGRHNFSEGEYSPRTNWHLAVRENESSWQSFVDYAEKVITDTLNKKGG